MWFAGVGLGVLVLLGFAYWCGLPYWLCCCSGFVIVFTFVDGVVWFWFGLWFDSCFAVSD